MKNQKPISIKFLFLFMMLALLAGMITLSVQHGLASTVITVNSTADGLGNDNQCTLREAIIAANRDKSSGSKPKECAAGSGADTIVLLSNLGDFVLTRADSGKEDASATGDLDIVSDVTIIGDGPGVRIVGVNGDHVFHVLSGQATIEDLTITGGNLPVDGGGIRNESQLTLRDVTISGNISGGNGGGIYNSSSGVLTIANSTLSGNQANGGYGGGLYNEGTAALNNVTVAGNTSAIGGGTANGAGGLTVQNTIVAGNFSAGDCSGTLISGGYNLIQDTSGCTISGDTSGNLTGISPDLGVLGDYGGYTFTYEPGEGSPVIDAGNPSAPGSGGTSCEQTDQRGTYRPHGETCDIGAVEVGKTNTSLLLRAFAEGSTTTIVGRLTSAPNTLFTLQFYTSTDPSAVCFTSADGTPFGEPVDVTTDSNGNVIFTASIQAGLSQGDFIVATTTDPGGFSSGYSQCLRVGAGNDSWPHAMEMLLDEEGVNPYASSAVDQYIDLNGQARWYKFSVEPNSKVVVTLENLPANYDLAVFKDIARAFSSLTSTEDLLRVSAEFAPDIFSPDIFSPDIFSPDIFSPDIFSPDIFSPDIFSPDIFSPDIFSPDIFSPDIFSPDIFSPDIFSPDIFSPDIFSPDIFSPEAYESLAFVPQAFSSAQTRSLIAVSAYEGLVSEGVLVNTWNSDTEFYIRVSGRDGVFNPFESFHLEVRQYSDICGGVSADNLPASDLIAQSNDYKTVILTDLGRMEVTGEGTQEELNILLSRLSQFAERDEVRGYVLDVSQDARVAAASAQSDAHPDCPAAQNLLAISIKELVDKYWEQNPLEYVVIIGNDNIIPFFRHADHALLANEQNFAPPVLNGNISQSSLRYGYVLSQDDYGARFNISLKDDEIPVPVLAVGRLVETALDATTMLDAYLSTASGVVPTPQEYLVTAYDFLEDTGLAVLGEFQAGGGTGASYSTLITPKGVSPMDQDGISPNDPIDPFSWSADDLRTALLEERKDMVFLGGHFSGNSALAADFATRILAEELANSNTDMTNTIIFSVGCHVGYNIVDLHGVPGLTRQPDWAQAAARKGATLIGGTGFQYGDTDFIKYSEEIYREFSRQLRVGSGPVSVGQALVRAKQSYLANTPYLRGIDEKAVLVATIFGLPMLSVDLPGERLSDAGEPSIVPSALGYDTNPGLTLGLAFAEVHVDTPTMLNTVTLDNVGGSDLTTTAYYFSGEDTIIVKPNEPTLPMQIENVSVPGTVLRGVGFRSGTYTDLPGLLPFTGAPATEIRGVHTPFQTNVHFPQRLYSVNYFDALANGEDGITNLFLYPAQYISETPTSLTGTWRTFQSMDLRLFYSSYTETFTDPNGMVSAPALAAAPTIAAISSQVGEGEIHFLMRVIGNPAAGIQGAWVTFTDVSNPTGGSWQSIDLIQSESDSMLWEGTLTLPGGVNADQIRYLGQAVNGVGLVSMDNNYGRFYVPGTEAGPTTPTELTLIPSAPGETVPTTGRYSTPVTLSARLTSNDIPLEGQAVVLSLGPQSRLGITDSDGVATVTLSIYGLPGESQIRASFVGFGDYQASHAESTFTIEKQLTQITLDPQPADGYPEDSTILTTTLTDAANRRLGEETLIVYISGNSGTHAEALITDYAGRVFIGNIPLPPGGYTIDVYFSGDVVPLGLSLSDTRYEPAFASGTISLTNKLPAPLGDAYQVNEDDVLIVNAPGVLDNDSDPDGQPLSAVLVSDVSNGTLSLNVDGSFSYAPEPNFNGNDSFTYAAYDGIDSIFAVVSITVNAINDVPVAVDDAYSVDEDNVLNVGAPGILANDSDVEGDALAVILVSAPSSGTLTLNPDGSFSYTPPQDYNGVVSFTYQVSDGTALSNVATVTITVVSVNDPPVCSADFNLPSLWPANNQFKLLSLSGCTDPDGDTVTITIVSVFQDEPVGSQPDAIINGASVDLRAERDGYGDGRVYHVTYLADDGQGGTCNEEVLIGVVPHDQSGDLPDGGALYDSTIAE